MKKLFVFMLICSLSFNALASKRTNQFEATEQEEKKELYFASDVVTTIAEYALAHFSEDPEHLMNVALLDKNFCLGLNKFARSGVFFAQYPEHQKLFIYLRGLFGIEKSFENVCEELEIKDISNLFNVAMVKLLDYLILIHDARVLSKSDEGYQRLLNLEDMLINHIAQLLPDNDTVNRREKEEFKRFLNNEILDAGALQENFNRNTSLFIERLRLCKENRQGLLRLFYLTLIIKKYNERHPVTSRRSRESWKATSYSECLLPHCVEAITPGRDRRGDAFFFPGRRYDSHSLEEFLDSTAMACSPELIDTNLKYNISTRNDTLTRSIEECVTNRLSLPKNLFSDEQRKYLISFAVAKNSLEDLTRYLNIEINDTTTDIRWSQDKKEIKRLSNELYKKINMILESAKPRKRKQLRDYLKERLAQAQQNNDTTMQKLIGQHIKPKNDSCIIL